MTNGTDQQQCCAADICCGGTRATDALAQMIGTHVHGVNAPLARDIAAYIRDAFDLLPKNYGLSTVVHSIAEAVRAHPEYEG